MTEPQEFVINETEQINLAVAAIAGWTNIKLWNSDPKTTIAKRTFIGTNEAHPELGIFIPNYVESLDAISWVFLKLGIYPTLNFEKNRAIWQDEGGYGHSSGNCESPAIAMCKLLLKINPDPIKPTPKTEAAQAQSLVVEATFG